MERTLLEHCDFSYAKLDSVNFHGSRFIGGRFAGRLFDVQFHSKQSETDERAYGVAPRNPMHQVDFQNASIEVCTFVGVDLRNVLLPHNSFLVTKMAEVVQMLPQAARATGHAKVIQAAEGFVAADAMGTPGFFSQNHFVANVETLRAFCPDESQDTAEKLLQLFRQVAQAYAAILRRACLGA